MGHFALFGTSGSATFGVYNVTLVTAFLDIGQFSKGAQDNKRDHLNYERWCLPYAKIVSPVVLYTDSAQFARYFLGVRRRLEHLTKVVRVDRSKLWSFSLRDKIAKIYSGHYPRFYPNTVNPDYTCMTHAKFDMLEDAITNDFFLSPYVAWMDVGYMRELPRKWKSSLHAVLPPADFNASTVLCGQRYAPKFWKPYWSVLVWNDNWVAGGFFLATRDVMGQFVRLYRRAVGVFLEKGYSQVEQQIIHAMYTRSGRNLVRPEVELQAVPGGWFHIGFRSMVVVNITEMSSD
ncbi:hypothetical protein V1264_000214 [Littorina saxatilis]|uniref:Uncharacterized protein n=2 Tax=Littorina saxatilis TaxID=31220 RepID=A0AAN9GMG6_9CAEN